ncbi:Ff.00g107160.m01.CDS01 [Fusarium sp. VM40]|nr:Ff.00g107160.m01.CDS01 [Fusarium sp. VM40]
MTANYDRCDIFKQFEIHRLSANHHLSKYFECLDRPQGTDSFAGLNTKVIPSRTAWANLKLRETARLAKTLQACAIQDLEILDNFLDNMLRERRSLIKSISPSIVAWQQSLCYVQILWLWGYFAANSAPASEVFAIEKGCAVSTQGSRADSCIQEWNNTVQGVGRSFDFAFKLKVAFWRLIRRS